MIFALVLFTSEEVLCQSFTSERERGTIGIGYQVSYPFHGFSVIIHPDLPFSFQGMVGIIGNYESYCTKIRYHFGKSMTYSYGLIGALTEEMTDYDIDGNSQTKYKTTFGYGIGFGVEYSYSKIPIWMDLEVGYGFLNSKSSSFKNRAIILGFGFHYYFPVSGF